MKPKTAIQFLMMSCAICLFSKPMFSQRQAYADANSLYASQAPGNLFSLKNSKNVMVLSDEKDAEGEAHIKKGAFKAFVANKFHAWSKPKKTEDDRIFELYALKASLDVTKTKYKEDYYERKALAKMDLEALILLAESFVPNPFEVKPGENSMKIEDAAKPQNYLQLRTGLRLSGRGDVQEADNGDTYKTYIYYLTLPLYLLYNHRAENGNDKFFAGLGPYYGYGLFGKFVDEVNGETIKENIKFGEDESGLRHGDFGLGLVAGYVFGRILFQLSYDFGFTNITFDDETKAFNRAFGFSVGYTLH